MKDFFKTFFGKGLLYAAVLISSIVLALSVLGAVYMIYSNYYIQSEEYIREEQIETMVRGSSANAFYSTFETMTGKFAVNETSDYGNFVFRIKVGVFLVVRGDFDEPAELDFVILATQNFFEKGGLACAVIANDGAFFTA